ncbi:MAG: FAD:protein FMN transferase [Gammaproteobacteria bacterium]|nr:FAD:protein FMN transferase [Gammaproteobacteria bacterium]
MDVTTATAGLWRFPFNAMASPCEVLLEGDRTTAAAIAAEAIAEVRRIEEKYSRYRQQSVTSTINRTAGSPMSVDSETAALLDYAATCYQLSEGKFDITTGPLRYLWKFTDAATLPDSAEVTALLPHIGWQRIRWQNPHLTLQPKMEIDLGGIGKEYAVDRAIALIKNMTTAAALVNLGGDLAVTGPRQHGQRWQIALENPDHHQNRLTAEAHLNVTISHGALATSGDTYRHIKSHGERYGHILNPQTGWPIRNAPRSITVAAATALEAGMLSTMASLQGAAAKAFLQAQGVPYWLVR